MKQVDTSSMIKTKIGVVILVLGLFGLSSYMYGNNISSISELDIIPRSTWGADENMRVYKPKPKSNTYTPQKPPTATKIKQDIAEKYLLENFSNEFKIDKIIKENNEGKSLKRPLEYKQNKKKIVIHHTAGEMDVNMSIYDEQQEIKNIYRYHAITRDRGDIGYNYIIGPSGKIYEGRYGGSEVVGAHAMWNNTDTIGISLLGNFDIQEPTPEQLESLIDAITAVSKQYNIDPYADATYHLFHTHEYPYINNITLDSIVGHGDVGSTSCPGKNLEKHMDYIKQQVSERLKGNSIDHYKDLTEIRYKNKLIVPGPDFTAKVKISSINDDISSLNGTCKSTKFDIVCKIVGDEMMINIHEKKDIDGNIDIILGTDKESDYVIFLPVRYIANPDLVISKLKQIYPAPDTKSKYEKISVKISPEDVATKSKEDISVLLHELTLLYNNLEISCTNGCTIGSKNTTDTNTYTSKTINITRQVGSKIISYQIDDIKDAQVADEIIIQDIKGGDVIINNYSRKSYAGIPWNRFSGKLIIKTDNMKVRGSDQSRIVYINQLPFLEYMKGLAEINDQEESEKVNALYIIAKNYAMFYMFDNKQDGMPHIRTYNLTDSPEINQKYVGAGFKSISKKRDFASSTLQDKYIYFNNAIAILPYFNCSAGYTNSSDRFGWTDTPYLKSVIDVYGVCDNKKGANGHGVGMSGKGANGLAKAGYTYQDIINYYYNGVEIK